MMTQEVPGEAQLGGNDPRNSPADGESIPHGAAFAAKNRDIGAEGGFDAGQRASSADRRSGLWSFHRVDVT